MPLILDYRYTMTHCRGKGKLQWTVLYSVFVNIQIVDKATIKEVYTVNTKDQKENCNNLNTIIAGYIRTALFMDALNRLFFFENKFQSPIVLWK